jgi:hypothetical protein
MWPGIDSSYKIKSQSDHGATSVDEMKIAKAWDILAARSHKKKKKADGNQSCKISYNISLTSSEI